MRTIVTVKPETRIYRKALFVECRKDQPETKALAAFEAMQAWEREHGNAV